MDYLVITTQQLPLIFKRLGISMLTSAEIFALTLLLALPFGLVVYFGKTSKFKPLKWLTDFYISIMRGTPLMLQLMVVFYGPYLIFGHTVTEGYRFPATIIAFVINYAAYFAEIYRGGIESIEKGQYEASEILGFTKAQTFVKIIIPQMIKRVLPAVTNEAITLVKDTSLAFTIGILEMFTVAKEIANKNTSMLPYIIAAVFYYIFNYVVAFCMSKIEKRLNYYKV